MMIRSESEFREAKARLADFRAQANRIRAELQQRGLSPDAIEVASAPQDALADDISWEVQLYEQLKAGCIDAIPRYAPDERGKALICLRIVRGWTQRQLAEALGVSEAVVSRDERSDYRGVSLEKYGKVLAALGFEDHPRFVPVALAVAEDRASSVEIPAPEVWRQAASFVTPETIVIHA